MAKQHRPRRANTPTADPLRELLDRYLRPLVKKGEKATWEGVVPRIKTLLPTPEAHRFFAAILMAVDAENNYPTGPKVWRREARQVKQVLKWSKKNHWLASLLRQPYVKDLLQGSPRLHSGRPRDPFLLTLWFQIGRRQCGLIYSIPAHQRWDLLADVCVCFSAKIDADSIAREFRRFDKHPPFPIEQAPDNHRLRTKPPS